MTSPQSQLVASLVAKLRGLKYEHRPDLRDPFQALNAARLTNAEYQRLLDEIVALDRRPHRPHTGRVTEGCLSNAALCSQ
jgi:hypothetical protein